MKPEDVAEEAKEIKPVDICQWTAERLVKLPKDKALSPNLLGIYKGHWSINSITKWLEERYKNTNNPGSVKMSCCNLLRASIKRASEV
ncbi:hypothetical protein [Desulfofustis glycolicus]|uniref:Uncharacterized protein n=1 Tax=Desulfofustis glycolicus DSM 9705 TaxID=1121409 RepID=A0A1M5YUA5_9BACT|nr:hypothetical protein [Desulfofustis glycolicus]SHI15682.1 hypothetical protein SAMN02745124_04465 [Desulfofustis glycolicus DSM 9705]